MDLRELINELGRANPNLWGLSVYEIDSINGTLKGSWTNTNKPSTLQNPIIMNEIARKRNTPNNILGTYTTAYIESDNAESFLGTLTITIAENNNGLYILNWDIIGNENDNNFGFRDWLFNPSIWR